MVNPGSTDRAWVLSDGGLVGAGLVGFCIDLSGAESRRSVTHRSIRHRGMCPVAGDTAGEQVEAGYVRHIGLSEVGSATLRRAAATHPICDLQI